MHSSAAMRAISCTLGYKIYDETACGTLTAVNQPDPAVWDEPAMRRVLAVRDIAGTFRLLQRHGFTQRQLADLTGISQSQVSEIMNGRQVQAYDVLERICEGLGIPRAYMGLAYDDEGEPPPEEVSEEKTCNAVL